MTNSNIRRLQPLVFVRLCLIAAVTLPPAGAAEIRNLPILVQAQNGGSRLPNLGDWRLVRTPGPNGYDVVSIMHTADALRSDPDFAGLLIRCRAKTRLQIALVVIRPFPPRSHPQVSIEGARSDVRLAASVLPGGSVLSLPDEAEAMANGVWRSSKQVSFAIEGNGPVIHGIVPLDSLGNAIGFLRSNCPDR